MPGQGAESQRHPGRLACRSRRAAGGTLGQLRCRFRAVATARPLHPADAMSRREERKRPDTPAIELPAAHHRTLPTAFSRRIPMTSASPSFSPESTSPFRRSRVPIRTARSSTHASAKIKANAAAVSQPNPQYGAEIAAPLLEAHPQREQQQFWRAKTRPPTIFWPNAPARARTSARRYECVALSVGYQHRHLRHQTPPTGRAGNIQPPSRTHGHLQHHAGRTSSRVITRASSMPASPRWDWRSSRKT